MDRSRKKRRSAEKRTAKGTADAAAEQAVPRYVALYVHVAAGHCGDTRPGACGTRIFLGPCLKTPPA